jgi:hypothetical protein
VPVPVTVPIGVMERAILLSSHLAVCVRSICPNRAPGVTVPAWVFPFAASCRCA